MKDNSVSIAKGIAIILMVLAHTRFSEYGNYWINMFHMPLFFFFAGYCFKDKYLEIPSDFVIKRFKGLYKPFVKWGLIFLVLHNLFFYLNIYNDEFGFRGIVQHLYTWQEMLKKAVSIVTRMSDTEQLLGGYWFLKSLFLGSLIAFFIIRNFKNVKWGGVALLCITILTSVFHLHIPYLGIGGRELFAALFFISGYYYQKGGFCIHQSYWIFLIGIVVVTLGESFWQATLLKFDSWQVIPYYISAIAGLLAVFYLSGTINSRKNIFSQCMIYIGNNTLTILTWHFLSFKLVSLFIIFYYHLPIKRLAEFPVIEEYSRTGWFILYLIIGTIVPLLFTKVTKS